MDYLFSHPIEVRFRDCDPLGHVNNAAYLTYLEQARLFYWRSLWDFGRQAAAALPGVIMARAEIDYKRAAKYGQVLDVRILAGPIGRTSFTYHYVIVDEEGETVAAARTVQVMYDYAASKPVPIPDEIRAKMTNT
jgi:acyl-CoA thioester hydrolase